MNLTKNLYPFEPLSSREGGGVGTQTVVVRPLKNEVHLP